MATKQDTIDRFKLHYPDADDTLAEQLFNEAHQQVLESIEARNSTEDISLTANTREYAISDNVVKIWEAYYKDSSTESSWVRLNPTSKQQLDDLGAWRLNAQPVRPGRFYETTIASGDTATRGIGFDTLPPTTTGVSGYPKVTLYCTLIAELDYTDSLPQQIRDMSLYVYFMCWRWAVMRNPEQAKYWKDLFNEEMNDAKTVAKGILARNEGFFLRPSTTKLSRPI